VSELERFYDLLFEISNEYRHGILLLVQKKPLRITDMTKELNLTYPEIRRHISRLQEVGLIERNMEGHYSLSPYGESSLLLLNELIFLSANREYFQTHTLTQLPVNFIKQIGKLEKTARITNPITFFHYTENLINESKEFVWLLVDQFPINLLSTISNALDRGVKIRLIEPTERVLDPNFEEITSEENLALSRTRHTPLVDQRMLDEIDAFLFISDTRCILALPNNDRQYDFKGLTATDESSLEWCRSLFMHYWERSKHRIISPEREIRRGRRVNTRKSESIVIVGQERPEIDVQSVQDAVDNYNEVILRGTFNFGASSVVISRSVILRGETRENNIPNTIIYKKGWKFPFTEWDSVFNIESENGYVTIENLHFSDFNCSCIRGIQAKNLSIKNNRITLLTGYGRGVSFAAFGDALNGIIVWPEAGIFQGNVEIKNNFLDFSIGGAHGGFLSRQGLEENPEYRPDLFNHEYYMGFGIAVHQTSGNVLIESNMIRNINARGIAVTGNLPSSDARITKNTIISDLYGSYPFASPESGSGILVQSAWGYPSPGFDVEITENIIRLDKINYTGIKALGPVMDRDFAGKLSGGLIQGNQIHLRNGYEGIHVRKCDDFTVTENTISGKTYYGIRISGWKKDEIDLTAVNNLVENNNMNTLEIKQPDGYSDNHANGRMFSTTEKGSRTSHVWLGRDTRTNRVSINETEYVIDEGVENKIKS
jgi:predicted transcriptional regulator